MDEDPLDFIARMRARADQRREEVRGIVKTVETEAAMAEAAIAVAEPNRGAKADPSQQ